MRAIIITIGDEILIGQIVDTNSAWIGERMNEIGVDVIEIRSIRDNASEIIEALELVTHNYDLVLLTGGLGPTKDDITKASICRFLKDEMIYNEEVFLRIKGLFERRGIDVTEAHKEQCFFPTKAQLLKNEMGTAPGMWFEHKGTILISMPGVPYEMKYIMEHEAIPRLKVLNQDKYIAHRTIRTINTPESKIADDIEDIVHRFPSNLKIAYLPNIGQVRLRLSIFGGDKTKEDKVLRQFEFEIVERLGEVVFAYEKDTIEMALGKLLKESDKTVSTAESCTGGIISSKITSVAGASQYYLGSVIAYDNKVKEQVLGVQGHTLEKHGAVSEEVVKEMVFGANRLLKTDCAIAVSGIAGPSGGTKEKPVGTIWIAVGNSEKVKTRKLNLGKKRNLNIEYTAVTALNMLRKFLLH